MQYFFFFIAIKCIRLVQNKTKKKLQTNQNIINNNKMPSVYENWRYEVLYHHTCAQKYAHIFYATKIISIRSSLITLASIFNTLIKNENRFWFKIYRHHSFLSHENKKFEWNPCVSAEMIWGLAHLETVNKRSNLDNVQWKWKGRFCQKKNK